MYVKENKKRGRVRENIYIYEIYRKRETEKDVETEARKKREGDRETEFAN